jgi:hypothetical protein
MNFHKFGSNKTKKYKKQVLVDTLYKQSQIKYGFPSRRGGREGPWF